MQYQYHFLGLIRHFKVLIMDSSFSKKQLNTRDKRLLSALKLTDDEIAKDIRNMHSEYSIKELTSEIARAKDPAIRQILTDQYNLIQAQKDQLANAMAPMPSAVETSLPKSVIEQLLFSIQSIFSPSSGSK